MWESDGQEIEKTAKSFEKKGQRFIETVISGLAEDRDGEMMSQEAVDDMIKQLKSGTIPFFGDHGRDPMTGMRGVYSWKSMMGVWVDGTQEGKNLKATLRLNNAHPDADLFWAYHKEGMPIGMSIGAKSVEAPEIVEIEEGTEPDFEKVKVTAMEAKRKQLGMSVSEFYAAPRDPPSKSALPIFDAAHVRNAMARFNQTHFLSSAEKAKARRKILAAARKFKIDTSRFEEK